MGLASLGAIIGMSVVAIVNWRYRRDFINEFIDSLRVKDKIPLGEVKLREMKEEHNKNRTNEE
jgi:hypothetical protein